MTTFLRFFPFSINLLLVFSFITFESIAQEKTIHQLIPGSSHKITLNYIPGGSFDWNGQEVSIDPLYCSTTEVTHDIFVVFKRLELDDSKSAIDENYQADGVSRPSPPYADVSHGMGDKGGYPAVSITQQAALRFCRWLYLKTGEFYRLPTEAEWTYLAVKYQPELPTPTESWTRKNSDGTFHKIGTLEPNKAGLYDMYGNVLEWTMDQWVEDPMDKFNGDLDNPWVKPTRRNYRVLKGGSFYDKPKSINAFTRYKSDKKWQERDPQIPKSKWWLTDGPFVGFRIVKPVTNMTHNQIIAFYNSAIID